MGLSGMQLISSKKLVLINKGGECNSKERFCLNRNTTCEKYTNEGSMQLMKLNI